MRIEDFQPRYAQPLVELWRKSFEHGVGITDPHPLQDQLAYFHASVLPTNRVRVALAGLDLVGFIASSPQSIECLYVVVSHIGKGIGSQLLNLAKSESTNSLWLYTFAQNANARAFYERHGFIDTGHGFENMWKLEGIKYIWSRVQAKA